MKEKIGDYYFDFDAVDNCWDELLKVEGVDDFSLSYEAVKEINHLLGVDQKESEEDIRAIRNAVVKRLSPLVRDTTISVEEWKKYNMYMSAITAAIDDTLYKKGYMV